MKTAQEQNVLPETLGALQDEAAQRGNGEELASAIEKSAEINAERSISANVQQNRTEQKIEQTSPSKDRIVEPTSEAKVSGVSVPKSFEEEKTAKEPWQMTKDEFSSAVQSGDKFVRHPLTAEQAHRFYVSKAIKDGKSVPENVLAEYPDIDKNQFDPKIAPKSELLSRLVRSKNADETAALQKEIESRQKKEYSDQAKELGITFDGMQKRTGQDALPQFTDPKTGTTFYKQSNETLSEALKRKRDQFSASEEEIVSRKASERIKIVDVPVSDINKDVDAFQNRKSEFSQESVDKIKNAVKSGAFNWNEFDPILLWKELVS